MCPEAKKVLAQMALAEEKGDKLLLEACHRRLNRMTVISGWRQMWRIGDATYEQAVRAMKDGQYRIAQQQHVCANTLF